MRRRKVLMEKALASLEECKVGVTRASDLLKNDAPQCSHALDVLIECQLVLNRCVSGVNSEEVKGLKESSGGFVLIADLLESLMLVLEKPWDVGVWEQPVGSTEHLGVYQRCLEILLGSLQSVVGIAPMEIIIGNTADQAASETTASFVIEDLSGIRESLVPRLLLIGALYSSVVDDLYSDPWTSHDLHRQSDELLGMIGCCIADRADMVDEGTNSTILGEIVADHADATISVLRGILLKKHPKVDDPMKIPDPYERTTAMIGAKGFVWFTEHLVQVQLTNSILDSIFPIVFSTIDNVIPKVRMMGLKLMDVVNDHADRSWLLPWRDVILSVLSDAIAVSHSGMNAENWHLTFPLAARVVIKIEGRDPRCAGYDAVLTSMFGGVGIGLLEKSKRIALMQGFQLLIKAMGLILVKYFAIFMPPLCSYACSEDPETMAMALQCLTLVSKHTWPRMPAHVNILWKVVMQAHAVMCSHDGSTSSVHDALHDLCAILVACNRQSAMDLIESPVSKREDKHELFKMLHGLILEDEQGPS